MSMNQLSDGFSRFGNLSSFAIDVRLHADPDRDDRAPASSVGSWGAWRLWVAGRNLCRQTILVDDFSVELDEVRWYLAPVFRWLLQNWEPLLHEARLPEFVVGSSTGRSAYLSMLQRFGDSDRFYSWQTWGQRHSIRTCSEGGYFPDIFFQRVNDEIEVSWGDRVAPGADDVVFTTEPGVARCPIGAFAEALDDASNWLFEQTSLKTRSWFESLHRIATQRSTAGTKTRLSWFLDSMPVPGPLYNKLSESFPNLDKVSGGKHEALYIPKLAPQVAMFGALSPEISSDAAAKLIAVLLAAETAADETELMQELVEDIPAWTSESSWDEGYQLAREVLEESESDQMAGRTDLDGLSVRLGINFMETRLGNKGPRGVAIAGIGYAPTIVVNTESIYNSQEGGARFTIAHELCHVLFDRDKAKSVVHASTPWAHPAVEQRANAFAAMLLMPPSQLNLSRNWPTLEDAFAAVGELSDVLGVGKVALVRHLANLGEIDEQTRDALLSSLQR